MIPKKIHYCWFGGGAMNRKMLRCLESWSRVCPDYEMIRWDESNTALDANPYVMQAYQAGKWAFVSDYVRLAALCAQGGFYLDTDVELRKPLDPLLSENGIMGFESAGKVATCVLAAQPRHPFFLEALRLYETLHFQNPDGSFDDTTNVDRLTALLLEKGLRANNTFQKIEDVSIFPQEYFSAKNLETGKVTLTDNTYVIHHFQASWMPFRSRLNTRIAQLLGPGATCRIKRWLRRN